MRDLDCLSAEKILSVTSPESLFSCSSLDAKQEYRVLARRWHPDHNTDPQSIAVFGHIVSLYGQAQQKIADATWEEPCEKAEAEKKGIRKVQLQNGSIRTIEYLTERPFELGSMFIADHHVTFQVRREFIDLFNNGRRIIHELCYKDNAMCLEMSKCLPQITGVFETKNAAFLKVRKTPDQLLLADVLKYYSMRIEPVEHVGWILNVLYNVACYLRWCGLVHHAISPDTFFISPLRHSGMLLGGWWYVQPVGAAISALPDRSVEFIPSYILSEREADPRADLELIKSIGRELLGDPFGSKTPDGAVRERLAEWLITPSLGDAVVDYREWKYEVLEDCFGVPKFVPMDLQSSNLYEEV